MSNPETIPPTRTRSLSPSDRSPGPRMTIHKDTFPHITSSLLEGLTGAASHGQGAARMSNALVQCRSTEGRALAPPRTRTMRASFSSETGRDVILEGKRKQVVEDVREVCTALHFRRAPPNLSSSYFVRGQLTRFLNDLGTKTPSMRYVITCIQVRKSWN